MFCDALLDRYAEDERVAAVTGDNFQEGNKRGETSYYFSKYNHVWGWASWSRAWNHYDGAIPFWHSWQGSEDWVDIVPDPTERRYWKRIFNRVSLGKIDSWAYPWLVCTWRQGGLTATPNSNLVANIGFGPEATHTHSSRDSNPVEPLGPLTHPDEVRRDRAADEFVFDHHFGGNSLRFVSHPVAYSRRVVGRVLRFAQRGVGALLRHGRLPRR